MSSSTVCNQAGVSNPTSKVPLITNSITPALSNRCMRQPNSNTSHTLVTAANRGPVIAKHDIPLHSDRQGKGL